MKMNVEKIKHHAKPNGARLKKVFDTTWPDKHDSEEMTKMAALVQEEANSLIKSGSELMSKSYKFLRANWKPTLAIAAARIGTHIDRSIEHYDKLIQTLAPRSKRRVR